MKRVLPYFFLILLVIPSCQKEEEMREIDIVDNNPADEVITGYNIRWRNLADFDNSKVLELTDSLAPELLRYPGGSVAAKWDWKQGVFTEAGGENEIPHPIGDLKRMVEATGSDIIFVVDVLNSALEDQLEMLEASEVPIRYVEIGNELYLDAYEDKFPTGQVYADTINLWAKALKEKYPAVKLGVAMIGRSSNIDRKKNWNTAVHQGITEEVDAYIYHIYVGETESVDERLARMYEKYLYNTGKETWITEYGAKSQDLDQAIELAQKIDAIANIALNHVLLSGSGQYSKLTNDCNSLTDEGRAFVERYNR